MERRVSELIGKGFYIRESGLESILGYKRVSEMLEWMTLSM